MGILRAPRFFGDEVLASCLDGHRIFDGSGDPADSVKRIQQALADLGFAVDVDGAFGPQTGGAVTAFKDQHAIAPDDPVVGPMTMTALDAAFAEEFFDLKAGGMAGGPFDLGQRTGTRNDIADGIATCEFEHGTVIELGKVLTFAVPESIAALWNAGGGVTGEAGIPITDPVLREDGSAAQHFVGASIFMGGGAGAVLTPAQREVVDWLGTGTPLDSPAPGPAGTTVVPCAGGAVVDCGDDAVIPLPQPVFDAWSANAGALGVPVALGFADSDTSTVFPFQNGSIVLSGGTAAVGGPSGGPARRFFLPADPSLHLTAPVSTNGVEDLLGGSTALNRMRADIASATGPSDFVYLAGWNCEIDLALPGAPAGGGGSLRALFTASAPAGVQLRVQLWASDPTSNLPVSVERLLRDPLLFARMFIVPLMPQAANNTVAVGFVEHLGGDSAAILDDRYLTFGSHHQKILVVSAGGNLTAYVGGIEFTSDRLLPVSKGAPLFDTSIRVTGPAVLEVLRTFTERWSAHPSAHGAPLRGNTALSGPPPAGPGTVTMQITHTYGRGFPYPPAIQTAAAARAQALMNARTYFYMEDQYFVGSVAQGAAMRAALKAGAVGIVVLAAEDSVSDLPDVAFRRRQFLGPLARDFPNTFLVFERLGGGSTTGPGAYVHSKLLIVDDDAACVGSVNSNRRSWTHDSEVDAVCVDDAGRGDPANPPSWGFARRLRADLWAQHLGVAAGGLGDASASIALWQSAAAGTLASASVRKYDALASVPRFVPPLFPPALLPLLPTLLDKAWDTVEDPMG